MTNMSEGKDNIRMASGKVLEAGGAGVHKSFVVRKLKPTKSSKLIRKVEYSITDAPKPRENNNLPEEWVNTKEEQLDESDQ